MTKINEDIVYYRWSELESSNRMADVVRLPEIRLQLATRHEGKDYFTSAVPVLMGDGRKPIITMSASTVYVCTGSREGKMIVGRRTPEEMEHSKLVPLLYSGDVNDAPWFRETFDDLTSRDYKIGAFNYPMWCRRSRSRTQLRPRDNKAVRQELGIQLDAEISAEKLKKIWDGMAENACCIGYCQGGFLWDADIIRGGGLVCVPRQYGNELNIAGACLKSDLRHIIKSQRWRAIKV